ncbi:MAG: hypothetical protein AAB242_09015 [Nitrospirota bacterium]
MGGRLFITGVLALAGLAAMLLIAVPSALAVNQPVDKMIGPQMESGKDLTRPGTLDQRGEPTTGELSKEMERPMKAPDTRPAEDSQRGYRPLCGPSKDAINHYACGEGYEHFAF